MLASFSLAATATLGACAGTTMARGTGEADTIEEDGSDDDGSDGDEDGAPTSADDGDHDDSSDTQSSADESPSDDDDDASTGAHDDSTSAATDDDESTTDPSATDDTGTTDTGVSATDAEDATTDDSGPLDTVDLSGFVLLQTASEREIVIPDGTLVPVGGAIVIGRDASLGQFEDFWSVTLDDVVYIDGGDNFPACNGDETFSLLTPLRTVVDGPTPPLVLSTGLERTDASAEASEAAAWTESITPNTDATPGSGLADGGRTGVPYIAEIVDATGAGNYLYEFVEIRVAP